MKFWRKKLQSCVLGLKFFGSKIVAKKVRVKCMLMKLTLGGGRWLRGLTALKSFHSIAFIVSKSKNFKREKYTFEASKRISA